VVKIVQKNKRETVASKRKNSSKPKPKKTVNESVLKRRRWFWGLLLFGCGAYIICAVSSFFFCWKVDQAFADWGVVSTNASVTNICGPLGAKLANTLVADWFGVFAVLLPVAMCVIAVKILRKSYSGIFKILVLSLLATIIGSIAIAYFCNNSIWNSNLFGYGPGGVVGVVVSKWLRGIIGEAGAGLAIALLIMLLALYINAEKTIDLLGNFGRGVSKSSKNAAHLATKSVTSLHIGKHSDNENEPDVVEDESDSEEFIDSEQEDIDDFEEDSDFETSDSVTDDGLELEIVKSESEETSTNSLDEVEFSSDNKDIEIVSVEDFTNDFVVSEGGNSDELVVDRFPNEEQLDVEDIDTTYDHTLDLSKYKKPSIELLEEHSTNVVVSSEELRENKNKIIETLENFKIKIDKIKATIGPTVTLYEIVPAAGIKISKIKNLENDIALSLAALGIRIIAPMPGRGTIGIEVPNKNPEVVSMLSVVKTVKFQESNYELPVVLGKTIQNETFIVDLVKMPHLLIAGATGQGKSVGLNVLLTSLLYKKHPSELKLVLVDPKKVELSIYAKLEKYFLAKMPSEDKAIITDTQKVVYTLNSLCIEMENRYSLLEKATVRTVKEYNDKFSKRKLNPMHGHRYLPYIVVVIDEFADMIMTAGKEVEMPLALLAQKARAVGIHLVIATQRPTTTIITGNIKANFPTRIAFKVFSVTDSRTILDQSGANQLIGRGDLLISAAGGEMTRVQCALVETAEVERVVDYIATQQSYAAAYELPEYSGEDGDMSGGSIDLTKRDGLFERVAYMVVSEQVGSVSTVQRKFEIGYNRAGRIMDQLHVAGIVGKANGSKPREVLISDLDTLKQIINRIDNQ
jgi:S-DNA-T family DNA segregation ATPase FtsK/SpoIIIE